MSLVEGTVSVNGSGVATGAGFARAIYDAMILPLGSLLAVPGQPDAQSVAYLQSIAASANALALALNNQTKTATVAVAGVTVGSGAATGAIT